MSKSDTSTPSRTHGYRKSPKVVPISTPPVLPTSSQESVEDKKLVGPDMRRSALRQMLTVKHVAERLSYSQEKVRQICRDGELDYMGRGRGYRIFEDSVAAYQERERLKVRETH